MHLRDEILNAADSGAWITRQGGYAFHMHRSAKIHPDAIIFPGAYIGPNVEIGADCVIGPNMCIGQPGFGYEKDEDTGEQNYRTHTEGVIIHDDVHIGSNTCVDQGRHRATEILSGARIDNLVHIAHNVIIGRRVLIVANSMIGGSCEIGDDAYISAATLCDHVNVGERAVIGLGSVVLKGEVPAGEIWAGSPARKLR